MKILLTGADGFTGAHFSRMANADGHEILALRTDLRSKGDLAREIALLDFTHVVHLAGISFVGHEDPRGFYDVNLIGTLNLLEALTASASLIKGVLLASSANVYGNCPNSPISEAEAPHPINHYAMSKYAMEIMASPFGEKLPLIFARPFNYTGPGQNGSFLIPKLVDHFKRKAPKVVLGNLDVEREFNDVRFVCQSYLTLLQSSCHGETFNICSGRTYTLKAICELLESLTGHKTTLETNPDFVRQNELRNLCGNPCKLEQTIGSLPIKNIDETLRWMLDSP